MSRFTVIEHVRHRVMDGDEGPWSFTACGRIFLGLADPEPGNRDVAHHEPQRERCRECYPA